MNTVKSLGFRMSVVKITRDANGRIVSRKVLVPSKR
jgi:hypothetical protein